MCDLKKNHPENGCFWIRPKMINYAHWLTKMSKISWTEKIPHPNILLTNAFHTLLQWYKLWWDRCSRSRFWITPHALLLLQAERHIICWVTQSSITAGSQRVGSPPNNALSFVKFLKKYMYKIKFKSVLTVQCVHNQCQEIQISTSNLPSVERKSFLEKKTRNFHSFFPFTGFPTSAALHSWNRAWGLQSSHLLSWQQLFGRAFF